MVWHIDVHEGAAKVPSHIWKILVGDEALRCPFLDQRFFIALEESAAAGLQTGWQPIHLVIYEHEKPKALIPTYIKHHSYGEYVFDHAWAHAFERAGGQYYPKLLSAIPFTPVPGHRILTPDRHDIPKFLSILDHWLQQQDFSSMHILFTNEDIDPPHPRFMTRTDVQFHWHNRDYQNFDMFLSSLNSRKRKQIRKEREKIRQHGLQIKFLQGDDIKSEHWDGFVRCHEATVDTKWGRAYLNRQTFEALQANLSPQLALVAAFDGPKMIAGAWSLVGTDTIFGRQWGCLAQIDFLHFEVCYYQAIERAIAARYARVEAGVQGEHKIARGFEPVLTQSWHWVKHKGFETAIGEFLQHERGLVDQQIKIYNTTTPYKKASV